MKNVLVIDETPQFREYLRVKPEENSPNLAPIPVVITAVSQRETVIRAFQT